MPANKHQPSHLRIQVGKLNEKLVQQANYQTRLTIALKLALKNKGWPSDDITQALTVAKQGVDLMPLQRLIETAPDEQFPPCDYCHVELDYHPWHGSGLINGVESPHIHACTGCLPLLPGRG